MFATEIILNTSLNLIVLLKVYIKPLNVVLVDLINLVCDFQGKIAHLCLGYKTCVICMEDFSPNQLVQHVSKNKSSDTANKSSERCSAPMCQVLYLKTNLPVKLLLDADIDRGSIFCGKLTSLRYFQYL